MMPSSKFDAADLERLAPSLAVGVGLALREVDL
jgi:Tfp pilus assembly PilM family ATPase